MASKAQRLQVRPLQPRPTISQRDDVVYHLRGVDLAVPTDWFLCANHAGQPFPCGIVAAPGGVGS